jgi:hypothetical protein
LWRLLHFNGDDHVEDTKFNRVVEWVLRQPLGNAVSIIKPIDGNQHTPSFPSPAEIAFVGFHLARQKKTILLTGN